MTSRCLIASAARALVLTTAFVGSALAQEGGVVNFISVKRNEDPEETKSNEVLQSYLAQETGIELNSDPKGDYSGVIEAVAAAEQPLYVARLTPYAFVAAELLGARFETLAAYERKTHEGETASIYNAYFVVRQEDFKEKPTLDQIAAYLKSGRRRFVYHDAFSTSSYLLPSLFFREHDVFDYQVSESYKPPGPEDKKPPMYPIAVKSLDAGSSSSAIIRSLRPDPKTGAPPAADIGAVWDGTYDKHRSATDLWFVRLDAVLPNDLLVCSIELPEDRKQALRNAIRTMKPRCGRPPVKFEGDVFCWDEIGKAEEARKALAALRRQALPQPTPVTVEVRYPPDERARYRPYVEAVEDAVRFADTEFVIRDPNFHKTGADFTWTLSLPYDGAMKLTSRINGLPKGLVKDQEFYISFRNVAEDLPTRVEARIHAEMNRIRYVWPFESGTVLRDINLSLRPLTSVVLQQITWLDPAKHEFSRDFTLTSFQIDTADRRKWQLKTTGAKLKLNPMSNVAYRVFLVRPKVEMPMFRYLTIVLVVLFLGAALAAVIETWRRARMPEEGESPSSGELVVAKAPPTGAKA
ncbi:MAG TPA: PhnD/SsuA/transferrin family substrate-binding protein [Thermoanaerobaculia bacterium]|nr:PhnD/SsuA/transferrin family substrate-binding protein [Thermoanaerobaculia bacterium]